MISYNECKIIFDLDLDPIKVKLMHAESGEGWSRERVDAVEPEYRRFLVLMKTYPDEQVAPLADVDTFWHYHILDTLKYAEDCERIFGYFLHHFPYVGLGGEADHAAHEAVAIRMRELYEQTFHETYDHDREFETADQSNHAASRKSQKGGNAIGSAGAGKTAYSIRVPQAAVSTIAAKSAYSIRVPQNAVSPIAAKSAYSIRVPQNAVQDCAAKSAYSIRVPQHAVPRGASASAYSIRVPQSALSRTADSFLQRPALAAAA
jgi:hypothetical protein